MTEQYPKLAGGIVINLRQDPWVHHTKSQSLALGWWKKIHIHCKPQNKEQGSYSLISELRKESGVNFLYTCTQSAHVQVPDYSVELMTFFCLVSNAMFIKERVMVKWAPVGLGLYRFSSYSVPRPGIPQPQSLEDNTGHGASCLLEKQMTESRGEKFVRSAGLSL